MTFGISAIAPTPPVTSEGFPRYIQFQNNGTDLGEPDVTTLNFSTDLTATRGAGESANTVTVVLSSFAQRKLRETKNIRDFGAAADNVTDDTAAIAAAALSGYRVRFEDEQLCRITSTITDWADNTLFEASGSENAGGVRLDTNTATANVFTITSKSDVHIQGLQIDAGRSGSHTAGSSVQMSGCSDSTVEFCYFKLPCSNTVLIRDACDNVKVLRNTFDLQGGGTAHIYFLTSDTNCEASYNYFRDSVGGCIWLSGGVLHTKIRGNRCDNSEFELIGIRYDCHFGEVTGNTAYSTGDNGISVTGTGFTVADNVCHGNDHAGIGVYGSRNTVHDNICFDNGKGAGSQHPGILLAANFGGLAADNVVTGNQIYRRDGAANEQYYGIRFSNTSYTAWSTGATITVGLFRTNGNRLYVSTTAGTTGVTDPTHTSGTASDGGVTWEYVGTFTNQNARPAGNRIGKNKIRNHSGGNIVRFGSAVNHFDDEAQYVQTYDVSAWVTATAYETGDVVTNTVSNIPRRYRAMSAGTSGVTAPTHVSGDASDGGVTWYYIGEGELNDIVECAENSMRITVPLRIECMDSTSDALAPMVYAGTVTPEGAVKAANGSVYLRSNSTYGIAVYVKTGTTGTNTGWQPLSMRLSGATGSRPGSLGASQAGLGYFDTSLGKPVWWTGAAWVDATGAAA